MPYAYEIGWSEKDGIQITHLSIDNDALEACDELRVRGLLTGTAHEKSTIDLLNEFRKWTSAAADAVGAFLRWGAA